MVATALTFPRSSWIFSVTVIVNHVLSGGSGGGGKMLQFTFGMVNTAPVVVCVNIVATPYDQSHATILPGADDILPLNVHSSVLPLFVSAHVSVSVAPVTPKFAVATVGSVTDSTADADVPANVPVIVPDTVPLTALVEIANVALSDPAGTVTLAGTVTGSVADSVTTAPSAGAAPVSLTVPSSRFPPTTLGALNEIAESATVGPTLIVGDWRLVPLADAVIVAVPAPGKVAVLLADDAKFTTEGSLEIHVAVLVTSVPPDAAVKA